MKTKQRLKTILQDTRAWAEEQAIEHDFNADLCGLCAIVAKELFSRLQANGFDCEIAYNDKHCFVVYKGRALDLTASQFGHSDIYISKKPHWLGYWEIDKLFKNVDDLSNYQEKAGWYHEQIYLS